MGTFSPRAEQSSMQDQLRKQPGASSPKPFGTEKPVQYTVFVRLPFPRHNFVDPPPVNWDAVKDKTLWKIISKGTDTRDLNWQDIAAHFDVSLEFLMQQAAWLYERHLAGVRKQMQRLASTAGPSPSPGAKPKVVPDTAGSDLAPASTLQRIASKGSRPASSSSGRRDVLAPQATEQQAGPGTPRLTASPFSRTPSSATITQSRLFTSAQTVAQRSPRPQHVPPIVSRSPRTSALAESRGSESDGQTESLLAHSQAFRRPPLGKKPILSALAPDSDGGDDGNDDDDEENSSAGFLPFATTGKLSPEATLRQTSTDSTVSKSMRSNAVNQPIEAQTETSSASSTSSTIPTQSTDTSSKVIGRTQKPGPLSPKHRAQLTRLSPRGKNGDGSEGAPSMGSSFSDLDDAGISASAIEDAVLSMQTGGASIASRVSGLSQAFRSNKQ